MVNVANLTRTAPPTDVYTDLNGLNRIKQEKSDDKALKKVAQQFESMFINILMKSMRSANAVFEEGSMFNSSESGFYRDMYDQQLSVTLSQKKGIGIADTLYKQMQNRYLNPARAAITQPSQERFGQANAANPAVEQAPASGTKKFNTPEDFVNGLLPLAEKAAQRLGVDAGYLVAQSALETGWGSKIINDDSGSSFNLFNIKASRDWQGASVAKETGEYKYNRWATETAQFRKYASFEHSFNDYVTFLQENPRYKPALEGRKSGEQFIHSLQQSGYATDPNYASKVISVYQRVMAAMDTPNTAKL